MEELDLTMVSMVFTAIEFGVLTYAIIEAIRIVVGRSKKSKNK